MTEPVSRKRRLRPRAAAVLASTLAASFLLITAPQPTPAQAALQPGLSGLSRAAAAEGLVMLRNDNGVLPLSADRKLSVFGRVQVNYFAVGYGSGGDVKTPYRTNLIDGLRRNPGITVNEKLASTYKTWADANKPNDGTWGNWPTSYPEMPLNDAVVSEAAADSDTALVVIGRSAGEDRESSDTDGSYRLTATEKDMLAKVNAKFNKVVVLLNTGNLIDMSWEADYPNVRSVLYAWQGGMEAGNAVADVLSGDESPSGKLPQTIANKLSDYPSSAYFGAQEFNNYAEDIFVGYRYFETFAKDKVRYPFGFGLSYSTFKTETSQVSEADGKITVKAKVTNTGQARGKEVVEVYYGAPQGKLGKASKSLVAYAKTSALKPGASEEISLSFPVADMASYDDGGYTGHESAWVLEAGEYPVYVGNDVRSAARVGSHTEPTTRVTEQLEQASAPRVGFNRWHASEEADGGVKLAQNQAVPVEKANQLKPRIEAQIQDKAPNLPYGEGDLGIDLIDVYKGKNTIDEFISQLNVQDLVDLTSGAGPMGHSFGIPGNASVYGGINKTLRDTYGIPAMSSTDGPSGIRMTAQASLLPIGTLLSSTWNDRLVEQLYAGVGKEMLLNGSDALLAPGMNIQRHPLAGRNFEYFSEDPILSGSMGSATTRGLQSQGVSATPKHFAANNQERNRNRNDSRVSERAQREIYLKGFEMVIKTAKPDNIMTAYNRVNGSWAHQNYDLATTILRDQWGWDGVVMTDWWIQNEQCADISLKSPNLGGNACRIRSGVDVLMPGERNNTEGSPVAAVNDGLLNIGEVQRSAKVTLDFAMKSSTFRKAHQLPLAEYESTDWFEVDQPALTAAPRLSSLTLDGTSVAGFSPDTLEYTVYSKDLTTFPTVAAKAAGNAKVTVTQAAAGSPFATILVEDNDGAQSRYRIYWSNDPDLPQPEGTQKALIRSLNINGKPFLPFYETSYAYTLDKFTPEQITIDQVSAPEGVTVSQLREGNRIIVRADTATHRRDYVFTTVPPVKPVSPVSDDFAGTALKSAWTVDSPTAKLEKKDGSVEITTDAGDWHQNGSGQKNTVWQHAAGDWTSVTELSYDRNPFQSYHQLGVVVFQDADNYLQLRLGYNNWDGKQTRPFQFTVKNETKAVAVETIVDATGIAPEPGQPLQFKVTKAKNVYTFAVSGDRGATWHAVGTSFTKEMAQPKFALQSLHGAANTTTDQGGGPTAGQAMVPIKVSYDAVTFSDVVPEAEVTPTLPTAPLTTLAATGDTSLKLASQSFFRTSGLQLENCSSPCTGQNVGYSSNGQYLLYNVQAPHAGEYTVAPRIAGGSAAGGLDQISFSLLVDEKVQTTFTRGGGTGGWQNWVRIPAQTIKLNAGLNKVKLLANSGGVNFDDLLITTPQKARELSYAPVAETRCTAGKGFVGVTVKNTDTVAVDVQIETAFGSKTFTGVQPGKNAFNQFATRLTSVEAGQASVTVSATVDGQKLTSTKKLDYAATSCK